MVKLLISLFALVCPVFVFAGGFGAFGQVMDGYNQAQQQSLQAEQMRQQIEEQRLRNELLRQQLGVSKSTTDRQKWQELQNRLQELRNQGYYIPKLD